MLILRRVLAVSAVAAASTIAFALPASAHTPEFQPSCDSVTIHLTSFSTKGDNTVHVLRDGQEIQDQTISPRTFRGSTDIVVPESWPTDSIEYKVSWSKGELADDFVTRGGDRFFKKTLHKPEGCETEPSPSPSPSEEPSESPEPTASVEPTATPSASVMPSETPSPVATTSAAAVQGAKLANTGAGNTVPMIVIGAVLVAGGAGLTFVTRRRRSASSAS